MYSFGPLGTGVCFSKPSFFSIIQKNNTRIEATNSKISGYSTFTNKPRFEVPYNSIITEETFDYLLWKVLWIRYQEMKKTAEVSIVYTIGNYQHITNTNNIIETHRHPKHHYHKNPRQYIQHRIKSPYPETTKKQAHPSILQALLPALNKRGGIESEHNRSVKFSHVSWLGSVFVGFLCRLFVRFFRW